MPTDRSFESDLCETASPESDEKTGVVSAAGEEEVGSSRIEVDATSAHLLQPLECSADEEPYWLTEAGNQVDISQFPSDSPALIASPSRELCAREGAELDSELHGETCSEADEPEWLVEAAQAVSLLESSTQALGAEQAEAGGEEAAAALARATIWVQAEVAARQDLARDEAGGGEQTRAALAKAEASLARMRELSEQMDGQEPGWFAQASTAISFARHISRRRTVVKVTSICCGVLSIGVVTTLLLLPGRANLLRRITHRFVSR